MLQDCTLIIDIYNRLSKITWTRARREDRYPWQSRGRSWYIHQRTKSNRRGNVAITIAIIRTDGIRCGRIITIGGRWIGRRTSITRNRIAHRIGIGKRRGIEFELIIVIVAIIIINIVWMTHAQ